MPNVFKKLSRGATNFFNKLPSTANGIVKKADGGLNQGLGVVQQVAKQAGNALEKVAPIAGAIVCGVTGNPEVGLQLSQHLSQAGSLGSQIGNGARSLRGGNLAIKGTALANQVGSGLQGTQLGAKLNSGVNRVLSNTQNGLAQTTNQLAIAHANIANAMG